MESSSPQVSMNSSGSGSGMKISQNTSNSFNLVAPMKLDRNNFLLWKSTVLPVIRGNRLEGFITGKNLCPPETITSATGSEPNPKFEEWTVMDQLLLGWLYSSLSVDVAAQLIDCKTSRELWCSTEEMVGAATRAKELWIKGELQRARKGALKMEEYLSKMKSLADNLQLIGSPLPLKDLIAHILSGLDFEYTSIATQLTYMNDMSWIEFPSALLTFESIIDQLNALQNLTLDGSVTANNVQTQKNTSNTRGSWKGSGRGRN